MGALTDNRKRRFADHRLPFSAAGCSLIESPSPLKKTKMATPPIVEYCTPPPQALAPSHPPVEASPATALHRFPPPVPLRRPVQGPQRTIRAFGLGSPNSSRSSFPDSFIIRERDAKMGTPLSRSAEAYKSAYFFGQRTEKTQGGLGLEQYRRLVNNLEQKHSVASDLTPVKADLSQSPSAVSELTAGTQKTEEASDSHVVEQKVEDEKNKVLDLSPVSESSLLVRRVPLYKELYEDSVRRHDSKLRSLEFEVKLAEKNKSSFHLLRKVLEEFKPKQELREPFIPLTDEEEAVVYHALHGKISRDMLVTHDSSNIVITREILQCLRPGSWLNDEVINLYLELLKEREKREPKKFLKCHFFNTFFYKKLISGNNGYDFKAVKRWTTQRKIGYSLIECDKVFVPIHKDIHWCLAVINVKEQKFQYLDSLGSVDTVVLRVLARYFMDEVKDKSGKQVDTRLWKQEGVDNLPLQENGYDCGMFMLKYTDFYSRGLSLSFGQEHMPYFRNRTAKEILKLRAE
ncbi:ubiquitin-like-specific protease ESD4 [Typha angustifolia]|uniref:ubiquitin-like-specific protease ESD4 n=1 Tax=Typha angustifolia TaxID=59011 RepID=UPI003C2EAF54